MRQIDDLKGILSPTESKSCKSLHKDHYKLYIGRLVCCDTKIVGVHFSQVIMVMGICLTTFTLSKVLPVFPHRFIRVGLHPLTCHKLKGHKARLNRHSVKQGCGMTYFETYVAAVTWFAIHFMIILVIFLVLAMRQINFVQAYPHPQALIEHDMYMELPQGIQTNH